MGAFGSGMSDTLLMRLLDHERSLKAQQRADELVQQELYEKVSGQLRDQEKDALEKALKQAQLQGKFAELSGMQPTPLQRPEQIAAQRTGQMAARAESEAGAQQLRDLMSREKAQQEAITQRAMMTAGMDPTKDPTEAYRSKLGVQQEFGIGPFKGEGPSGVYNEGSFNKLTGAMIDDVGRQLEKMLGIPELAPKTQATEALYKRLLSMRTQTNIPWEVRLQEMQKLMKEYEAVTKGLLSGSGYQLQTPPSTVPESQQPWTSMVPGGGGGMPAPSGGVTMPPMSLSPNATPEEKAAYFKSLTGR